MLCIAHRGGAALRPENTLEAFCHAIELGCDGAELDVQLTRDGEVVVVHDFALSPDICRDTTGRWLERAYLPISELTLAELQRFDVGRAKPGSNYAAAHPLVRWKDGARIPTLAQVVKVARTAPRPFQLFAELKTSFLDRSLSASPLPLAEATVQVLREHEYVEHTTLVSFDWRGLLHARQTADIECWFTTLPHNWLRGKAKASDAPAHSALTRLSAAGRGVSAWVGGQNPLMYRGSVIKAIAAAGGQGWFADYRDLTAQSVAEAGAMGLKVGAWTINDLTIIRAIRALGIDVVCTDRPDLLLA